MDDLKIQPTGDKNPHEIPLDQLAGDKKTETPADQPQDPASPTTQEPSAQPAQPAEQEPPAQPTQPVEQEPPAQPTQPAEQEPPAQPVQEKPEALKEPSSPPGGEPPQKTPSEPPSEDPKKKNLFKYIIIAVSILILLGVGYLAYGFLSTEEQPVEEREPTFTPPEEEIPVEDHELDDVINDLKEIYEIDESPPGLQFDIPDMDEYEVEEPGVEDPEVEEPTEELEDPTEEDIDEEETDISVPEEIPETPERRIPR